ncbi:hypothetical protein ACJMK2_031673, partial [Sinanodonta woodiana]
AIDVPIYVVIPVTIVTLLMVVGCVKWIYHKRISTLEKDQSHPLEECDRELYITPIGDDIHQPIPLMNDGNAFDFQTAQSNSRMLILHTNQNMNMDGYEIVDDSIYDAPQRVCNSDGIAYELTETIGKPGHTNCAYLTALGPL